MVATMVPELELEGWRTQCRAQHLHSIAFELRDKDFLLKSSTSSAACALNALILRLHSEAELIAGNAPGQARLDKA